MRRFTLLSAFAVLIATTVVTNAGCPAPYVAPDAVGIMRRGNACLNSGGYTYPPPMVYHQHRRGGGYGPQPYYGNGGGGGDAGAAIVGGIFGLAAGAIIAGSQQAPACTTTETYDQYGRLVKTVKRCPGR